MRSMATPTDQNDMISRMMATAHAVGPIAPNISMMSIPAAAGSSWANAGTLRATNASAANATCPIRRIFPTPITQSSASVRNRSKLPGGDLIQSELDGDGHDDGHGHVVEQRRRVLPLPDGVDGRLVEERDRTKDAHVLHFAVHADGRLEDHDSLYARGLGNRRIDRIDLLQLSRLLDLPADAHRGRRGRRRWWRRLGQAANDSADDATGDTAFDADVPLKAGVPRHLRLDFLRGLDRCRVRIHDFHRLGRRLRRRRRRRWGRR